jgi:benzoyl-CoA-dihydrodiol lyase
MSQPTSEPVVSFATDPNSLCHWHLSVEGETATLTMQVSSAEGLRRDYELKLNSYDLSVDIELADVVTRLRFEHPAVKAVVVTGGIDKVFCAGANIQMLCTSSHAHKVNFCKLTNETRNTIEESGTHAGQGWIAAVNGTAAGGGYELALACDEIVMIDDRASAVSLPEVPLLAVLPGTGGLTRLVDKRLVRRDLADVFATRTEGCKAAQALEWRLVDHIAPRSEFAATVAARATAWAARSDRPGVGMGVGVALPVFGSSSTISPYGLTSTFVDVVIDRAAGSATFVVRGPVSSQPTTAGELLAVGEPAWLLRAALELDHAIVHLRFNEPEIGTWVLRTEGDGAAVLAAETLLDPGPDQGLDPLSNQHNWLTREVRLLWERVLKRLDLSARTLIALVEPSSCFAGVLAELVLAADRSFMLDGSFEGTEAVARLQLSAANDGWVPMSNGLSRLASRFWGRTDALEVARKTIGTLLDASAARAAELVTFTPDDIDWDDDVRIAIEERASFSPDALTAMEANFRFVGPETIETKIFARLTAWQNWIFQRPNAVGPDGALHRFGTGSRPVFDKKRV